MDNGNDDDLEYGSWMKGARLPTTGYDKYRTDFLKANAWPFVTRLARKALVSSIPQLVSRSQPQPSTLYQGESSTVDPNPRSLANNIVSSPMPLLSSHTPITAGFPFGIPASSAFNSPIPTVTQTVSSPTVQAFTHPSPNTLCNLHSPPLFSNSSLLPSHPPLSVTTSLPMSQPMHPNHDFKGKQKLLPDDHQKSLNVPKSSATKTQVSASIPVTDLTHIYVPDVHSSTFATYPPVLTPITMNSHSHSTSLTLPMQHNTTHFSTNITSAKENQAPHSTFKRANDSLSMRKLLKRCRNTQGSSSSPLSRDDDIETLVSDFEDSSFSTDSIAEVARQPRNSS
ncbi:hypothetical protein CsatA_009335 [Cannabis sativa]